MFLHDVSELTRINKELKREIATRRQVEEQLEQRSRLLSTLLDVSNLVSSTLDLRPLLESILDRLGKIIEYDGAKVFILENGTLKLVAHRTRMSSEEAEAYTFELKQISDAAETLLGNQPTIIPDIWNDNPIARLFRDSIGSRLDKGMQGMRSWMGLPLVVKDRVVGALTADHCEPGFYMAEHAELGMAFANQVAIELENARLYNESVKKTDELKTMFAVHQAITSRLDLESVLALITEEARRLTNTAVTSVILADGEDLVFSAFSGGDPLGLLGKRIPIEKTMIGRTMLQGKSVIFKNSPDNPEAHHRLIGQVGVKTYLIVPLISSTGPVGVISASDKKEGEFTREDERILNMFASSAVIGIENARMYREEQRRHREDEQRRRVAEGLRDILGILNSNRPLEEVLRFIICEAGHVMGTDSGALYRLRKDKGILVMEAACGLPEEFLNRTAVPLGAGAIGQAVLLRKPVVSTDIPAVVAKSPDTGLDFQLKWLSEQCNGLLAVPLVCKDEVYGGIALYFKKSSGKFSCCREFSKEEIDLAAAFADQAALAIDNAMLREQAEKLAVTAERSRLARDLHDSVTQTLFSSSLIAEVLPRIWERNPADGKKRLDELQQLTRGAMAEMRTLLLELRPTALAEARLEDLLKQAAEATQGRARIPVSLKIEGSAGLPMDIKVALFRITQEALNNIAKHSGANQVDIAMSCFGGESGKACCVLLSIRDDGRGFDPGEVTGEHLGLGIMRERAEAINAVFTVHSKIGEGTEIRVLWEG